MRNLLLTATLLAGLAHAQDAIPYASLSRQLTPFGTSIINHSITVVTTDGVKHKGRELRLGADGLRLFPRKSTGVFYPKERIARIEIARGPRDFRKIGSDVDDVVRLTRKVCGWRNETRHSEPIECVLGAPIVAAATSARAGINAPFYFIGGIVDAFSPPEVYHIAP